MQLVSFYTPLKHEETSGSHVFRGYRKRPEAWNGLIRISKCYLVGKCLFKANIKDLTLKRFIMFLLFTLNNYLPDEKKIEEIKNISIAVLWMNQFIYSETIFEVVQGSFKNNFHLTFLINLGSRE